MSERNRLYILITGVVLILVIIILIRGFTHTYGGIMGYFREEIILYIGVFAILVFGQFIIGSTYGDSAPKNVNDSYYQNTLADLRQRFKSQIELGKKKIKSIEKKNADLNLRLKEEKKERQKFENSLQALTAKYHIKLSFDNAIKLPEALRQELYFWQSVSLLRWLREEGNDDFNLEAAIAYSSSIQLYDMINILLNRDDDFQENELNSWLKEYNTELNNVLNHVKAIEYGIFTTYKPDSHQVKGMVNNYDQVQMKSFKIISNTGSNIIYKALVEKR